MGSSSGLNRRSPVPSTHYCSILKPRKVIRFMVTMNLLFVLVSEVCMYSVNAANGVKSSSSAEEDEFAEFMDEDDLVPGQVAILTSQSKSSEPEEKKSGPVEGQRSMVRESEESRMDEESESFVEDEEEEDMFERMAEAEEGSERKEGRSEGKVSMTEDLKFTKVPIHLRASWSAFYVEMILAAGILVYFINFLTGRSKNSKVANAWFESHRELLDSNFALVGDDGKKEIQEHGLIKETESVFFLWCSGRVSCESMLLELRLWKRHDLLSLISKLFKPVNDQVVSLIVYMCIYFLCVYIFFMCIYFLYMYLFMYTFV